MPARKPNSIARKRSFGFQPAKGALLGLKGAGLEKRFQPLMDSATAKVPLQAKSAFLPTALTMASAREKALLRKKLALEEIAGMSRKLGISGADLKTIRLLTERASFGFWNQLDQDKLALVCSKYLGKKRNTNT